MSKILIVDDEPEILRVLQLNLDLEGYETMLAGDGATAIRRITAESPALVLLDIMMPLADGWEVLQKVSEMKSRKRPRVIVMTAKSGEHNQQHGMQLGADAYVTKPFDIDEILELVQKVLALSDEEQLERPPRSEG